MPSGRPSGRRPGQVPAPVPARPRRDASSLVRTLWIGWLACVLLFLLAWTWAASGGLLYHLKSREGAIAPRARELAAAFAALDARHDQTIFALAYGFERGTVTPGGVESYLSLSEGLLAVHWVDAAGRSRRDRAVPIALVALARAYVSAGGGLTTIRPEPPGWRAGLDLSQGVAVPPPVPEGTLAYAARRADGEMLVVEVRLDDVYGRWLDERLRELGLPADAVVRHLPAREVRALGSALAPPPALPAAAGPPALPAIADAAAWRFPVATLLVKETLPFDQVAIEVDNRAGLAAVLARYAAGLLAGLALLAAFALALALAARAVRRDLALALARADFTAMVSHELRTPVAAIAMYAEILEHRLIADPEKVAAYHAIIGTEAARLRRLVDDLLDLGRIERGGRAYTLAPEDLGAVAREGARLGAAAFDRTAPPAIAVEAAAGLPAAALDRQAATQAIANLVHNALKYGGTAEDVRVEAHAEGGWLVLDVLDRGPGVPAGRRADVFDPYIRLEREDTRTRPGTGLGLALVKGYVEGQGGRVEVLDRPGGGACFRLRLAIAAPTPVRAASGETAA